jgi:2-polyprenyl-6-methoxyphenol hydroxylase-like FAD-dependent oxidoreductase
MNATQPAHSPALASRGAILGRPGPRPDCQVLVVGAGPTGLVLGAELLARGIRVRIIDKGDGVALQTRAIGIHARTLEVLDMMGLAERFTERGHVVRHLCFYSHGRCLASLEFARCGSRFGFMLDLPQDETERLLRARITELGGVVEQRTELSGLTAGGDAVTATLRGPAGDAETITAGYVAGCDGAHSRVRHQLGLTFHGHPYPEDWLLADVLLDGDLREDTAHAFFRADGLPVIFFPMRGHRWRVTLPFAGRRGEQAPSLDEIQRLTDQRAPQPFTVSDPTWLANFHCHRRSASAYRRGRVLLAGDAVHIHSPAGGQGMNTGIMDAHNLAWKLALVTAGRAPDALLDTYGTERRPVADAVLNLTHALVRYGSLSHPVKRRARDIIVPALGRSPSIQRRAARRISHVSVAYPPGPLARRIPSRGGPKPGQRMPDLQVLAGGQASTLHHVLGGGRHVLVVPAADVASVLREPGLQPYRSDLCIVTGGTRLASRILNDGTGPVVLVRPDGYVAARGRPGKLEPVTSYLRGLFFLPHHPTQGFSAGVDAGVAARRDEARRVPAGPSQAGAGKNG